MTWIPVRAVAPRASLAASLALLASLIPALARAARAYVSNEDDGTVTVIDTQRVRSEEHTSELQSPCNLVCRLLLEKKKKMNVGRASIVPADAVHANHC